MNNFIKQSMIADEWQRKMFIKLTRHYKKDKSITISIVHDSIIISKKKDNEDNECDASEVDLY